jgi:Fe-S cluster biogenesis protein NfuA
MKIQQIQPTPNPNAYKFILDERVLPSGVRQFNGPDDDASNPLAANLFRLDGVESLFFCENFVTVTLKDGADWRALKPAASEVFAAHQPTVAAPAKAAGGAFVDRILTAGDGDLLTKITEVLDDRVRPALAGDGGGLEVLALDGKTLSIRYQGACGTCPSSIAGTLSAIENMLQSEVDEEIRVVAG